MSVMFISDIHGIKNNLKKIKEEYDNHKCNQLIVLGDLYYADSKYKNNDYDVEYVEKFLESFQDNIICIRGNCDSNQDIERCKFKVEELSKINIDNQEVYITHGHIYNETNWHRPNTILVFGHYHVPFILKREDQIFINPGSISLPKNEYVPSYLIWENNTFTIYDIENHVIDKLNVK